MGEEKFLNLHGLKRVVDSIIRRIPTKTSELDNDRNYTTESDVEEYVQSLDLGRGSVTNLETGVGLTGGPITETGTIKADLVSETRLSQASEVVTEPDKIYAVALDRNGKLAIGIQNIAEAATQNPIAIGAASVIGVSDKYAREDHTHNINIATGDNNGQVKIAGVNVSVKGLANYAYKDSLSVNDIPDLSGTYALANAVPTMVSELENDAGYISNLDIAIPSALSELSNDVGFITEDQLEPILSRVFTYQGTKQTYQDVVVIANKRIGDVWFVLDDGSEYAWNGEKWEKLGSIIDLSSYLTEVQIAGITISAQNNSITIAQLNNALNVPTKTSDLTNDSGYITQADIPSVPEKISDLQNDSGFITAQDIPTIPDSTSDLVNDSGFITSSALPTSVSDLVNDSGFITISDVPTDADTVNGHIVNTDVPSNAVFTDTTYTDATTSSAGLMSASDKTKLNGIESGAEANVIESVQVDGTALPINNKTVNITEVSKAAKVTGTQLTNEDLNDIKTDEFTYFWAVEGNTCTHIGLSEYVGHPFVLTCVGTGSGTYMQRYIAHKDVRERIRTFNGSSWSRWDDTIYNYTATTSWNGLMSIADKTKLNGIESGAQANVQSDWNETNSTSDAYILNKPDVATTTSSGLMPAIDKVKLNLIEDNAQENIIESISVNGDEVEVIDKNVDITIPKTSDLFNERTTSGNPIYIDDAVNAPATNVTVGIESIQDLNGYDHPWVGGAGNNLLPKIICTPRTENGITLTSNDDGSIHVSGTATKEVLSKVERVWETTDETDLTWLEAGTYTVNAFGGRIWVMFTNEAKEQNPIASFNVQNGGSRSITLTEKLAIYIRADILASDGALDTDVKASVVSGSTGLTIWEPYENICPITGISTVKVTRTGKNHNQEQEVKIELNDETFGGTLDVTNGKLTLTHYVYNIPAISSIASSATGTKKYVSFPSVGSYLIDKSVPAISDRMTWVEYANRGEAYHFYYASSNNAVFVTFVPEDATVDSINADLVGGQIVYQLDTPIEYTLTSQQIEMLSGENIIWSNANGDIDVTYKAKAADYTEVEKKKLKNTNVYFGTCNTTSDIAEKEVVLTNGDGFELVPGTIVGVKFTYGNNASNSTLNVNGTGAKSIWVANSELVAPDRIYSGEAGFVLYYMYDGSHWAYLGLNYFSDTRGVAYCATSANNANKYCYQDRYILRANNYINVVIRYDNTAQSALTFNIIGTGAKSIYINGEPSSETNYILPAGAYIVYYDGEHYQFRTDGKIPGPGIMGDAATVNSHTINSDVPANAIFTDTTYSDATTSSSGLMSAADKAKLNGVVSGAVPNYFGVCSDSEVTRTVTVDSSFTLAEGVMVNVFFENQSTSNATLNVNDTGAYPIYIYGTQPVSNAIAWGWRDNQLVELVFHDSKWWVQNQYFNNAGTTTAGLMTSSHVTKLDSLDPNSTAQIVLTNENLDDIHPTATTWYVAAGGNSVTSKPGTWVTSFGMVCFRTAGGYITQLLWPTGWAYHYCRTWDGTSWTEWVCIGREASSSENGLMSVTDKTNLDSIVGTQLTNEDLNNIHPDHFAIYYADGTNTCTHKPTGTTVTAFGMICIKVAYQYILQIVFPHTTNRTFTRYYNGSSSAWSAWRDQSITYTAASGWQGLMSAADKVKLDSLKASTINVTDTYGVAGTAGATVTIQALMDAIASKV